MNVYTEPVTVRWLCP